MAILYRPSDIVPVKVDDITVNISPLTFEQKMKIKSAILENKSDGPMLGAKLACQYAIKSVSGIILPDGSDYKLSRENDKLTDECWDDLHNIKETQKLITICLALLNGMPEEFIDPQSGKKLEGVKIIEDSKGKKK
jgi:hypothetical protein